MSEETVESEDSEDQTSTTDDESGESEGTDKSSGRSNTPEPTSFEVKKSGIVSEILGSGKLDQPGWYERVLTLYEKGVMDSDKFDDGKLETLKRIGFVKEQNDKVWLTGVGQAECNNFREKQLSHARTNVKGIISILTAVTAAVVSIGFFLTQTFENVPIILACGLFLAVIYVFGAIAINFSLGYA